MKFKNFRHLCTLGFGGLTCLSNDLIKMLALQAKIEKIRVAISDLAILDKTPEDSLPEYVEDIGIGSATNLHMLRELYTTRLEPDLSLLGRLNDLDHQVNKVMLKIESDTKKSLSEATSRTAEKIKKEALQKALDTGIPGCISFLKGLRSKYRQVKGSLDESEIKKVQDQLEDLKSRWQDLLREEIDIEVISLPKFLILLGLVVALYLPIWFLKIPLISIAGLAWTILCLLIFIKSGWPVLKYIRLQRKKKILALDIHKNHRKLSFLQVEEINRRAKKNYIDESIAFIDELISLYEERAAYLQKSLLKFEQDLKNLKANLKNLPPTLVPIYDDKLIHQWFNQGKNSISPSLIETITNPHREVLWENIDKELLSVFSFLKKIKLQEILDNVYPSEEDQRNLLISVVEAVIGRTAGEGLLSLNFGKMDGRRPQINLIFSCEGADTSKLTKMAREILGRKVGLYFVNSPDAGSLYILAIIYGFPLKSIKGWETMETKFVKTNNKRQFYPLILEAYND